MASEMAQMCYIDVFYNILANQDPINTNLFVRLCDREFNLVGQGRIVAITIVNAETRNFKVKLENESLETEYASDDYEIIHFVDLTDQTILNILSEVTQPPKLHNKKVVFFETCYKMGF